MQELNEKAAAEKLIKFKQAFTQNFGFEPGAAATCQLLKDDLNDKQVAFAEGYLTDYSPKTIKNMITAMEHTDGLQFPVDQPKESVKDDKPRTVRKPPVKRTKKAGPVRKRNQSNKASGKRTARS